MKCDKCEGFGIIEPISEKLEKVMTKRLYEIAKANVNTRYGNDYLISLVGHTTNSGGASGDIITHQEIDEFIRLGYYIGAIGQNYVYVKPLVKAN